MSALENIARIDSLVESAARALFESHGLSLGELQGEATEAPDDHDIAASIGFTSPQVQGAILMTTRKVLVARAWPRELRHREPSEREVCDWAGELVNQLLGRIKNALLPFGLVLEQSTPTVVVGKHVHRAPPSTNLARRYYFDTSVGTLLIYFDAAIAKGLSLTGDASVRPAPEGDVHLF
ncbi:MAG: chemotaxis protein CheX [Polyangiaceae bacterium]|jgi:chemotaxis protein CheX